MRAASTAAVNNAEIFYSIRLEDRKGPSHAQHAWQTKERQFSSAHARRCVRALLKNETLKQALDPLLDMPGLRQGLMISTMNKLLDARADEEAAAYLRHTDTLWMRIVGSRQAAAKITVDDVQTLELRCPKFCSADTAAIVASFERGTIFSSFSESERDAIRREVLSIETIITSLHTFSQDNHVLEACAASMRHIVTPSRSLSIRQTLLGCFKGRHDEPQGAEQKRLSSDSSPAAASVAGAAMQELWAFMLGNFPDMCPPTARLDTKLLAGPPVQAGKQETIVRAATLAHQLGFRTPEIQRLVYATSSEQGGIREPDAPEALPLIVDGRPCGRHRRCGRPRKESYQFDRTLLTRANLRAGLASLDIRGPELTSFFVLRCQYAAFFDSVTSSDASPNRGYVERIASEGPAEASIPVSLSLEQSIRELRRHSDSSEYTSVTIADSGDDTSSRPRPAEYGAAVQEARDVLQLTRPPIVFKEYSSSHGFRDVEQVGVDRPEIVTRVARELKRKGKSLFSLAFDPLQPDQCFRAAQMLPANTIIVLPDRDATVSEDLRIAVGQLS